VEIGSFGERGVSAWGGIGASRWRGFPFNHLAIIWRVRVM
jgi:hypothetical protein